MCTCWNQGRVTLASRSQAYSAVPCECTMEMTWCKEHVCCTQVIPAGQVGSFDDYVLYSRALSCCWNLSGTLLLERQHAPENRSRASFWDMFYFKADNGQSPPTTTTPKVWGGGGWTEAGHNTLNLKEHHNTVYMDHSVKEAISIWSQPDKLDRDIGFTLHATTHWCYR